MVQTEALSYSVVPGWEQLPAGWENINVAGAAVDSQDRVFLICRGDHPIIIYDRDGKFVKSWGEGQFSFRTHGISIGPDDMVYCTDDVVYAKKLEEAGAAAPIEEARIVVAGGRGVGGEDGFKIVEEIAEALGGAVGATRAAVDAGWIPYAQQIGQTGKIVKPQLYLALGISGAIQHKVGMQTAGTIVAVNRDPDAPIAEFADLVVIGDLFEVAPALLAELRARSG